MRLASQMHPYAREPPQALNYGKNTYFSPELMNKTNGLHCTSTQSRTRSLEEGALELIFAIYVVLYPKFFLDALSVDLWELWWFCCIEGGDLLWAFMKGWLHVLLYNRMAVLSSNECKYEASVVLDLRRRALRPVDLVLKHPSHCRRRQQRPEQNEQVDEVRNECPQIAQKTHLTHQLLPRHRKSAHVGKTCSS